MSQFLYAQNEAYEVNAQVEDPQYTKVDNAILKVQIESDRKHGGFRSALESREIMYTMTNSIRLSRLSGRSILYEFLRNKDDVEDSVLWSKAIAKNKYATDEERLELPRAVLEAAVKKGLYRKSDKMLNCNLRKVGSWEARDSILKLSFYSSIKSDRKILQASASTVEDANKEIDKLLSHVSFVAAELGRKEVSGILFAYTTTELQFCEVVVKSN